MATVYTVPDLLQLTMALFQYPDGWVGTAHPGRKGPSRAASMAQCAHCVTTDPKAYEKLKGFVLSSDKVCIYLFPTYDDLCGVRYDIASPKCTSCGGPKK